MKKIIWYWNLMHYFLWQWKVTARKLINAVNPVAYYGEDGMNTLNQFSNRNDMVYDNSQVGMNRISASASMGGLLVFMVLGLFSFTKVLLNTWLHINWHIQAIQVYVLSALIALLLNHALLLRGKKYLLYFNEFDKMPSYMKDKYERICLVLFLSILLFGISSFVFL